MTRQGTNLEKTLAAAVKLHAEADAAGLTGAGELTEQSGQDGAGQCLLQQRGLWDHTGQVLHEELYWRSNMRIIGQDPRSTYKFSANFE